MAEDLLITPQNTAFIKDYALVAGLSHSDAANNVLGHAAKYYYQEGGREAAIQVRQANQRAEVPPHTRG